MQFRDNHLFIPEPFMVYVRLYSYWESEMYSQIKKTEEFVLVHELVQLMKTGRKNKISWLKARAVGF